MNTHILNIRNTLQTLRGFQGRLGTNVEHVAECWPCTHDTWVVFPAQHKPGMRVHICNPSIRQTEPRGPDVQGLGSMRPVSKTNKQNTPGQSAGVMRGHYKGRVL